MGLRDPNIEITDKEWGAIQAGAISENKLTQILNNTNTDTIRQRGDSSCKHCSGAQLNRIVSLHLAHLATALQRLRELLGFFFDSF